MLEELISEIHAGGTLEVGRLASRLGTSPEMVEAMLMYLQRSGLIQPYVDCGDGCQGCGLSDACKPPRKNSSVRLWQNSPKE
jgi:hypothetical protein